MTSSISILEDILQNEIGGPCRKAIKMISSEQDLPPDLVAEALRAVVDIHPFFDQKIAAYIDQYATTLSSNETIKLLDVLYRISDCSRVRVVLVKLRSFPDPRIQSKVALLLGRGALNVKLMEEQLASPDARVRANAIESLPLLPDLKPLLRQASSDPNNRVVGNALLSLHRLGDAAAITELTAMASHESEAFRITALWVMGETADARFAEILRAVAQKESGKVRWMALKSLGRLKRASAPPESKPPNPETLSSPAAG